MINAIIENGELVIRLPINQPLAESSTGKTKIVATTRGNQITTLEIEGKNVFIGVNAYILKK